MNSIYGNEKSVVDEEHIHSRNCFLKNAFLFLDNAERILGDSRMSQARVPVSNGLAYMGPFPAANLGVYVDWWQNSGLKEILHDREGRRALTWHIAGSPLSGMNSCSCVYPDGTTANLSHSSFGRMWKTFHEAIKRHRTEGLTTDIYAIEEVAEILKTDATTEADILRARLTVQQKANARLRFNLNQTFAKYQDTSHRYENICLKYHKDELFTFRRDLRRYTIEIGQELQTVAVKINMLRQELRNGKHSKEEHKMRMRELNQLRSNLEQQLAKFKDEGFARLSADGELSKEIIESYLRKNERGYF